MEMYLVWGVILLSLIAFIVFLVKGFKGWGVWMTIGFVILFLECWGFIVFSAGVNAKRIAAVKTHDSLYNDIKKLTVQRDEELFGKAFDPGPDMQRFVPLSNELHRLILERGRAWRGARVTAATPASATVILPTELANLPPDAPAEAAAAVAAVPAPAAVLGQELVAPNSVVYVFGEDQQMVPRVYLGEYKVTTVANALVTIVPTSPLSQAQLGALNQSPTWAIYEMMPLDSHTAFAKAGAQPTKEEIFGNMDPEELSNLLRIPLELAKQEPNTLDINRGIKARVLQSYLRDGTQAPEGTPLESSVYEVTFLKDYTEVVDSTDKRKATEGGYFDTSGRSVDARLMREEGVEAFTFKEGDEFRLDGLKAKELEKEGVVKLGAQIFIRPLNDYEFSFRDLRRLTLAAMQNAILVNREIEVVNRTEKISREELIKGEENGRRYLLDKGMYDKEMAVIQAEQERLQNDVNAKKAELSQLYAKLVEYHDKLVSSQAGFSKPMNGTPVLVSP
ncbi:MAG: hypothetical protein LW870_08560 [Pirellula sp.]|jgi:hypothetical protein|nr:hypothetical protein [Pirellula sp.]